MGDEGHMYPTTFEAIGGLIIIMYPAQNVDQYLLKGDQQAGAKLSSSWDLTLVSFSVDLDC